MFFLYNIFVFIVIIFSPIILLLRIFKKKEDPKRFKEKLCIFSKSRGRGKLIWIHGSSVGEITSVIPLISQLEKDNRINKILVTSSTTSSTPTNFSGTKLVYLSGTGVDLTITANVKDPLPATILGCTVEYKVPLTLEN